MKFIEALKTGLKRVETQLADAEIKAQAIVKNYQEATEEWKEKRSDILLDTLLESGELKPSEQKKALSAMADLADDAHLILNNIYMRRDRIRSIYERVCQLEHRHEHVIKIGKDPKLFKQHKATDVMRYYQSNIRLVIQDIQRVLATSRYFIDTTKAEELARTELEDLEDKLAFALEAQVA